MKRFAFLVTFAFALAWSSFASAQTQPWLADRRYTEGRGIRVGDFELHPGAAAEFGYDSNYFLRGDDEDPIGSLRLRITPSFSLATLSERRRAEGGAVEQPTVEFRAGIHATYDEFFPISGSEAGQDALQDQRNVEGKLDFNLNILPGRPVFGSVGGTLSRNVDPSNAGDTTRSLNRVAPTGNAEIGIAPGGGLFEWRLGYNFVGTIFESGEYSNLTNFNHEIQTRGRWRFLPRSALTFDGRFGFINYPDGTTKTSSHPMRVRLGFNGLITNSIGLLVMGGWGASFYTPTGQQDFDSFIGQAEFRWLLTPSSDAAGADEVSLSLSNLAVGFTRDFGDSFIGSYVETNRGYAKFSYFFAGRFLLVLDAAVAANRFPEIPQFNQDPWTDIRVEGGAFGEWRFIDQLGLNATVRYATNISDTVLQGTAAGGGFEALQWQNFTAFLGFRWFL